MTFTDVVASKDNFPLLAELLAEQQRLDTPVARFSTAHDSGSVAQLSALSTQLIPLTKPQPGEQYAFEVDLDSCTGCKACVAACHALNGLDDTETWRDVGLIVSPEPRHALTQTVTTACHHCADPACLNGCPVLAYEKDPATGIVRHLDDQCIGCSYCVLKCPYDVPKYNPRLGIVRKCDMCHGRLAHGEAPACVQACPTSAIRIVTVGALNPRLKTQSAQPAFLAAAPDPAYTRPTTRYLTTRAAVRALVAADAAALHPQPPHWPLVFMLTLLPLAIGAQLLALVLRLPADVTYYVTLLAWGAGALGLGASVLHLGQPRRAWRVFLGWRRSWLSREAIVFGAWFPLASVCAATRAGWLPLDPRPLLPPLAAVTAALGALGLFCSVMIYADTRRAFWRVAHTAPRFFGSAVVLGLASAFACAPTRGRAIALALATFVKLAFELRVLRPLDADDRDDPAPSSELKSARLLAGLLRPVLGARAVAGLAGGVLLPVLVALGSAPAVAAWPALAFALLGELAERYLFFRAVDAPKMPGVTTA